jgi:D-galactarolactone cycloisomerase
MSAWQALAPLGDTLKRYIERTLALRSEFGPDAALLAGANCRAIRSMTSARCSRCWPRRGRADRLVLPLAACENLCTRYDFQRLVSVVQTDLSRCGGITEGLRIAALASGTGLPVCTHGCHTGLNFAASVH